jgi:hypothetical protein
MNLIDILTSTQDRIQNSIDTLREEKSLVKVKSTVGSVAGVIGDTLKRLPQNKRIPNTRKALLALFNVYSGMNQGLESKDLSIADFRRTIKNVEQKFLPQLEKATATELKEDQTESNAPAMSEDLLKVFQVIKDMMTPEQMRQQLKDSKAGRQSDDELKDKVDYLRKFAKRLPDRLVGEYDFVTVPIVPMIDPASLFRINFDSAGIKTLNILGFPVLEHQTLLAVSRKLADDHKIKPEVLVQSILEIINERSNDDFTLVSEFFLPSPRNSNILMFWVMPSRKLNTIIRQSGSFKVEKWGYPWANL